LRLAYNFYYTKGAFKSAISQTLALSGDVSLTKKTRINYTTGFDIARKEITMTSVGITRDLHCWDMSLDWIPTGYMKSWQFVIKVKASVLADLKYDRRKDFRDQY
jgi:lipopolysaccharide assembly outer membrane protein LptD (OstA)